MRGTLQGVALTQIEQPLSGCCLLCDFKSVQSSEEPWKAHREIRDAVVRQARGRDRAQGSDEVIRKFGVARVRIAEVAGNEIGDDLAAAGTRNDVSAGQARQEDFKG